jgi:[ribosomal protein S5]-alanine N-acetyltransferase
LGAVVKNAFLIGKTVYLRAPDLEADVLGGDWAQWFNDPSITKFLYHGNYPNTPEKQLARMQSLLEKEENIILAIVDIQQDILLGTISLQNIDFINRTAEIAMVIGAKNFPKYCAPFEAMALLTEHTFSCLNLNKIYAGQHVGLWKWVNRLELLGYKLEGYQKETHFYNGNLFDSVRMGLLAKDFFSILEDRKGNYLPEDLLSFLDTARKDNLCEAIGERIAALYSSS